MSEANAAMWAEFRKWHVKHVRRFKRYERMMKRQRPDWRTGKGSEA